MPIVIADVNTGVTVTEAESFFGKLTDGMVGALTGDNLTADEAFWAAIGYTAVGAVVGSKFTRSRISNYDAAGQVLCSEVKPILGLLG